MAHRPHMKDNIKERHVACTLFLASSNTITVFCLVLIILFFFTLHTFLSLLYTQIYLVVVDETYNLYNVKYYDNDEKDKY